MVKKDSPAGAASGTKKVGAKKVAARKTAPRKLTVTKAAAKTAAKGPSTRSKPANATPVSAEVKAERKKAKAASAEAGGKTPAKRLVRDSFTIPKDEYQALNGLRKRAVGLGQSATKKSELLRAGIRALAAMSDDVLLAALAAVPTLKTGRPKRDDAAPEEAGETSEE